MKYNTLSRRFFLQGAGCSLMVPFLPSLLSEKARAELSGPPLRYIQFTTAFGIIANQYFPSDTGLIQQTGGVFVKPLSSESGDISTVLGPAFTPHKGRFSLLRGLRGLNSNSPSIHNSSVPTCASGLASDGGVPWFPYSIDTVLSESSKVYPNAAGKQRLINISPNPSWYGNMSWNKINGQIQRTSQTQLTSALLAKFPQLSEGLVQAIPTPAVTTSRDQDVIQAVYSDYKTVRDSGKLSTLDKARFESYMQLIDEIQKEQANPPPAPSSGIMCSRPQQEPESSPAAKERNQLRILAAALACRLTQVVNVGLDVPYDTMHTWVHNLSSGSNATNATAAQRGMATQVAFFVDLLAQLQEEQGSILDNSIVYYGNEFGELVQGREHVTTDMIALVAGGAAGKLQTGYYIDYRKTGGVPINNLLVTIFNAMGMSSGDYKRDGVVGFGEYNAGAIAGLKMGGWTTNAGRISPLPFFYKGPVMG